MRRIAFVGRPNVGKSSLFNRILGKRKAIVDPSSGTTRDRLYADVSWKGKKFTIIDAGGFKQDKADNMAGLVLGQLEKAIEEADIIFFVVDGVAGILPQDRDLAIKLRKTSKKIYLIVNKIDNDEIKKQVVDFFELGLGEPYAVSAMHDIGIEKLLNDLIKGMDHSKVSEEAKEGVKVAIIGRPNVGKSSYLNALLDEERAIVHSVAGTTRDSTDTEFVYNGKNYILIDTAGIRHKTNVESSADFYATVRAKEVIGRCDIAVVLLDGADGLREDDEKTISLVLQSQRALIIAVNKWDIVKGFEMSKYQDMLIDKLKALRNFPILFISSKTGRNVKDSLGLVEFVYNNFTKKIPPEELKETLKLLNETPEITNKRLKFDSLAQSGTMPPSFILKMKNPGVIRENLKGYIENWLRKTHDFNGVPISIEFTKK